MSTLSTIVSTLAGASPDQISADVAAAERAATIAYAVIAIELGILIFVGIAIARKL